MTRTYGVMLAVLLCGQLADAQDRRPFGPPGPPAGPCDCNPNCNGKTFVLIAPGSTEYLDVQERLNDALEFNPCPIVTRVVNWATLEYSSYNYQGQGVQVLGAARMAGQVMKLRQCYPNNPIVLLGWEAGARVALLAAEQLPPGAVDRIILLSPAVSSCYDVRCALKASKCGIDMYYSSDDPQLAEKESIYGTADGSRGPVAGRTGFFIKCKGPLAGDPILMGLRQFDVSRCEFLGDSGEFTTLNRSFMRRYVVPLLPCGVICGLPGGYGPPPFPPQGPLPPSGPFPPPPQGPYGPPPPPMTRTPNGPVLPPVMPIPPLNRTPPVGPAALQGTNATTASGECGPALPPLPPPPAPPLSGPALPPPTAN